LASVKGNPMGILRIFKVRETGNAEFWVSNLVIVLSTVLGVYLAAQAGYTTAIDFEQTRTDREGYYMRRALLDEVRDNLDQADQWSDFIINKDGWRYQGNPDAYKLQSYVWETMKEQATTFQLAPAVLTGVRRYYDNASGYAMNLARGQGTAIDAAKAFSADTKKMREQTVPVMEKDIASLKGRLDKRGIALD
jgi:hypothetical protein